MIADITVTEKSFGPKLLMSGIRFSVDDGEKVGVIGRNGVGKSTLFGILRDHLQARYDSSGNLAGAP